ncbi:OLC1v1003279C1 [Oldenlandia corymbosa var. corymbosa]|uniref:Glycosyltransferase n=1 Tax=Oldenlandia corymbosa var. corymbosa TaxID=529605 RepID=A0AAV1D9P5_OLDCO|nr:OLC1v1003279C1 [Oldenlandia corymbosa var. corymbosa]
MGSEAAPGSLLHVFLVSFPAQGHVNPMLRLGKRLASKGLLVTLSAPELIGKEIRLANKISEQPTPVGDGLIRFEFFDDEWVQDEEKDKTFSLGEYLDHLAVAGKRALPELIEKQEEMGHPVACLIINPFIPWVYDVADSLQIPSATLWVQSAASFSAYYHYYNNLVPFPTKTQPDIDVQLPAMPLLKHDEIPSFLHPNTPYPVLRDAILFGLLKNLSKNFCVLMDTFEDLEKEEISYMSKLCPIKPIGPLFKNPKSSPNSNSNVSVDILKAEECLEWLDSKPASSVVYISFGSIVLLKDAQITEIAHGLLDSGVPFLWVIRPPAKDTQFRTVSLPEGFMEKVGDNGKLVKWCPQELVLAHKSLACFLTHCGWNSTLESLASGAPVITFPQWGDQVTDAKYLVDVFKVGIRLCRGEAENRIIPREEVKKCLIEATSGSRAAELKENALKWNKLAGDAVAEGGSSDRNLQEFVDEVRRRCIVHTAGRR